MGVRHQGLGGDQRQLPPSRWKPNADGSWVLGEIHNHRRNPSHLVVEAPRDCSKLSSGKVEMRNKQHVFIRQDGAGQA